MMREGKRCAVYVRVSTEMQVDGFSLDAQKNVLKKFVEREGMTMVNMYEDAGKSGKSIEGRPAFSQLLSDIANGLMIDYVVVYKLSRFGRNAADILNSLEFIQSYDINLIATEEGIDSSQTSGKLLISVLSAVSEIERENILEQTMNGRKEKARQGGWNGGFAPYGYTLENGKLIINEEEAETVRKIFDMYVNTNKGRAGIAKELNLQGIEKVIRQNGTLNLWRDTTINNILRNPIYIGMIAFGRRKKEKVKGTKNQYRMVHTKDYICEKGHHEAIIDMETWEKARKKQEANARHPNPDEAHRIHLLSGLLKCPACGASMAVNKTMWQTQDGTKRYYYDYRCSHRGGYRGYDCTHNGRILTTEIEPYVISIVKNLINNEEFIEAINEQLNTKVDTSGLKATKENYKKKLSQTIKSKELLEEQIDNLTASPNFKEKVYNDMTKRLYKLYDVIEELETSISDLELKIKGLESDSIAPENVYSFIRMFNEVFDQMNEEERRKLIKLLIDKITFTLDGRIDKIYLKFVINKDGKLFSELDMHKTKYSVDYTIDTAGDISLFIPESKPVKKGKVIKTQRVVLKKEKVTYKMIKDFILENFSLKAHTSYIAEVKRKYGIKMINVRSTEETQARAKHPTEAMTRAIEAALVHFKLINQDQITD